MLNKTKKTISKFILILSIFIFITSCTNPTNFEPKVTEKENIQFQGETIVLADDISKSDVDYFLNFDVANVSINAKKSAEDDIPWNLLSGKEYYDILEKTVSDYPNFHNDAFSDLDFEKIQKGIPSIKDKNDAINKKHIVVDYFEIVISKDFKKRVKQYLKTNKNLKKNNFYDTYSNAYNALNPTEQIVANNYPSGALNVKDARESVQAHYGSHNDNTITNAKLHFSFSAAAVKEITHYTLNKWKGLDRGKQFLTAHEYDTNGITSAGPTPGHVAVADVRDYSVSNYMDLNNNLAGRTYMYNSVGQTWLGNANNIPTYASIYAQADNCSFNYRNTIASILAINSNYTIDTIGHRINAYDYHTPTQNFLVYFN